MIRKSFGGAPPVFDRRTALMYSGDNEELLKDFINDFIINSPKQRQAMTDNFDQENWSNYTTIVHAVKSSSLSVGGKKISAVAKKMEQAGKDYEVADTDDAKADALHYIKENHADLLKTYDEFITELRTCLNSGK